MTDNRTNYNADVQSYLDTFGTTNDPKLARHTLSMLMLLAHEKGFKEGLHQANEIWRNACDDVGHDR